MGPIADLVDRLNAVPLAGLMLVVALGYSVGRLKWRWVTIGPGGGTLFVAILFGVFGLSFAEMYGSDEPTLTVGQFGFALFIYSVGFEAGPRFFSVLFGGTGWRFVVVGTVVNVVAVAVAVICARVIGFGETVAAGSLSGALTSFPTYAAAAETLADPNLLIFFAVSYPVGLVAVIFFVQVVPRLFRVDLSEGADPDPTDETSGLHRGSEAWRVFKVVREEVIGQNLSALGLPVRTGCTIVRVKRGAVLLRAGADTKLLAGDRLLVQGHLHELAAFGELVGPEVGDQLLDKPPTRNVVVLNPTACERSLADLDLTKRHGTLVTAVDRGGVILDPVADLALCHGDVVELTGSRSGVRAAALELGRFEKSVHETDIAIYAGGICLGLLFSQLRIGGTAVLGAAGGLLFAGIVLGRFRRIGHRSANVPRAARQLVRDLGILLFIAEMGIWAGGQPLSPVKEWILPCLTAAFLIAMIPMLAALFVGRKLLRLRAVDTWGSICGGMTSSAALVALKHGADSSDPAVSYAASYAVASVLATLAGPLVVYLI